MSSFPKTDSESFLKKDLEHERILYNSMNYQLTGNPENFKIIFILLSTKIKSSIKHNPKVTVSVLCMFLAK